MWSILMQGLGLGLVAGAQPGPFQAYAISEAIQHGWRKAWPIALVPLLSDGPIILLVLLGLRYMPAVLRQGLLLGGGLFLLYLAWRTFQQWRRFSGKEITGLGRRPDLLRGAMVNLLNPNPYIFWSMIAGPLMVSAWRVSPVRGLAFLVSFYGTMIAVSFLLIGIFGHARDLGLRLQRALLGIAAFVLCAYGFYQLYQGVGAIIY